MGSASHFGPAPDLKDLDLGDPPFKVDFRDVYATMLRRRLRVDPELKDLVREPILSIRGASAL